MKVNKVKKAIIRISKALPLLAIAALVGCAATAPKTSFTKELRPNERVDSDDNFKISITAGEGVIIASNEVERLSARVREKIETEVGNAGLSINEARELSIEILISRYDKGNAFARAMLAGLGQIHIDATVSLVNSATSKEICSFEIKKTFAWGGLYGSSTSIADVEHGWAQGIAKAIVAEHKNE